MWCRCGVVGLALFLAVAVPAADVVSVSPIHSRILMVHFDEGHVVPHGKGQRRTEEKVVIQPLNVDKASAAETYRLTSAGDPAYRQPVTPSRVGRKSKGTEFAWFVDSWENNRAVNHRPDHTKEHWIYVVLPEPMQQGQTYTLSASGFGGEDFEWTFVFDAKQSRSESVHVNLLGYVPDAPRKVGYVFHWAGDLGGIDFKPIEGKRFWLVEEGTRKEIYEGKVGFRKPNDNPETAHSSDSPPFGNFLNADVYECDFSSVATPGRYVLAVEGVGCSFPFEIGVDVYRPAFIATARALYHNRSGIELKRPYTEFERPAPHHPLVTPGFAGKLRYTPLKYWEWGSEGGDKDKLMASFKGPLDVWGWYQDAGDWDSYPTHWRVPAELLFAYEIAPGNFADGDLNLPESGNGIPDILDEATWLLRFGHRLRHALMQKGWGTGGLGLRVAGDAFGGDGEGTPSYEDVDRIWAISGEDRQSTFGYAATAAHLAWHLRQLGKPDPEGVDWEIEAKESYNWAKANPEPGNPDQDERWLRYAAAAMFRLTGDQIYENDLRASLDTVPADAMLWQDEAYGVMLHALASGPTDRDPELAAKTRAIVLATADHVVETANRRALRWGGNFWFPMLVGQQTTPWMLETATAMAVTKTSDPERSNRYRETLYTTADYFLGANALNMTWITGVGPRYPSQIFHMDAWYNGKGTFHPGLIPYSPWRKEKDEGQGPWDVDWPNTTVYPKIDLWPGNERWFSNRCSPLASEFTVHQNTAPAAAIYGILSGPAKR
ncbi:MAG: glycoside hydrolase family 9 protein [Fimbriimonadaceae bacterium]